MLFPSLRPGVTRTTIEIGSADDGMPTVLWAGPVDGGHDPAGHAPLVANGPGMPLLGEQSHGLFTRPQLRGFRIDPVDGTTGAAWTPRLLVDSLDADNARLVVSSHDPAAGLSVVVEIETLAGGALRARAAVTNTGEGRYVVEGLELCLPVSDQLTELLDFTGRHERERTAQRHQVTDGLWLRESRGGRPGLESATQLILGQPGFSFGHGEVLGVHVAWSGNTVMRVERSPALGTTVGGGELLLPGEMSLDTGECYTSPWVMFAAAADGLDGLAASWHAFQRALPTHPDLQPVVLNVWEAVYFDHDLSRLKQIADRAHRVGVERFVLDDGWFRHRRDDTAGLGDWYVDEGVWPDGLTPIIDHVRELGMEFGLWFEPEMINPDSDLYRAHPEWVLSPGDRLPLLHRNQLVLDLTRPDAFDYVLERMDDVLSTYAISFVKWDHNRELLEAGSGLRGGAAAVHEQTLAYYRLLDTLRSRHPGVAWESCAAGGGRIDLGVLERTQRVWTSDMTDALARQEIQRWTLQLIAPEYAGAHVSSPVSHSTWRSLYLDFRAATALFGAFGIEWDLTQATEDDLDRLASWVDRFKRFRPLLHSGRMIRPESSDPAVLLHGVVAADRGEALVGHFQLDESAHNRGVWVRVPGLDPDASYELTWEGPVVDIATSMSAAPPAGGPTAGQPASGYALGVQGFWMPRGRPELASLVHVRRID